MLIGNTAKQRKATIAERMVSPDSEAYISMDTLQPYRFPQLECHHSIHACGGSLYLEDSAPTLTRDAVATKVAPTYGIRAASGVPEGTHRSLVNESSTSPSTLGLQKMGF